MPPSYDTATKTARMQAVADAIDSDASAGYMELCTAAYAAVVCTVPLETTCGTVSGDTLTFSNFPKNADCTGSGTIAAARIKDGAGTTRVNSLTVGTSGADVILDSVVGVTGKNIKINSATIQHAA